MSSCGRGGAADGPGRTGVAQCAAIADVDRRGGTIAQAASGGGGDAAEAEDTGIDGNGTRHRIHAGAEGQDARARLGQHAGAGKRGVDGQAAGIELVDHQIGRGREGPGALDFISIRASDEIPGRRQVEAGEIKALRRPGRRDLERIDGAGSGALELAAGERIVSGEQAGAVGRQGARVGRRRADARAETGPLERRGGALA